VPLKQAGPFGKATMAPELKSGLIGREIRGNSTRVGQEYPVSWPCHDSGSARSDESPSHPAVSSKETLPVSPFLPSLCGESAEDSAGHGGGRSILF